MRILSLLLVTGLVATPSLASKIDADKFVPGKAPKFEGALETNEILTEAERLAPGLLEGPEDIAVDSMGRIYTGTADGYVKRLSPSGLLENYIYLGGHPLGLDFDAEGNLYVCEPSTGLFKVSPEGGLELISDEANGVSYGLVDDVKVAKDGNVYFTDASFKFPLEDFELDVLENRGNGRLMKYDPKTKLTTVLLDNLYFANGVALSEDESFILVNETSRYQITRLWLKGEQAGKRELFASNLPGMPDGLARDSEGNFLIAFYSKRSGMIDFLQRFPKLKNLISHLPKSLFPKPAPYGFIGVMDENGDFVRSFHDTKGEVASAVTSVEEFEGFYYFGTLKGDFVGKLQL